MKIRAVTLNDVRQFSRPVRVSGIGDGVNVLSAPNETGKSTLFDAIQYALFVKHTSKPSANKFTLTPNIGGNPEVTLEIEQDGARLEIRKRWGRQAHAEVWRNGALVAKADEAEAMIAALTTPPEKGGPTGLLWVRQGLTEFAEKDALEKSSRANLLSSVTDEIETMTGGKRMDRALARAREDRDRLVTTRGAKAGGPLDAAEKDVTALSSEAEELSARAARLREALETRRVKRRSLGALTEPDEVALRSTRLQQAQAAFDAADRHAAQLQMTEQRLQNAALTHRTLDDQRTSRDRTQAQVAQLARALDDATQRAESAQAKADETEAALTKAGDAEQAARAALQQAEAQVQVAQDTLIWQENDKRRAALQADLAQAEALAKTLPDLRKAAETGPDAAQLDAIDKAARELAVAQDLAEAAAPRIAFDAEPGAPDLHLDGTPLGREPRSVARDSTLDLPGLGRLRILPASGDLDTRAARARDALASALTRAGATAADGARAAARARIEAGQSLRAATEDLRRLAPEGIDALRAEIARLAPTGNTPTDAPSLPDAQTARETARKAEADAQIVTSGARTVRDHAREAAIGARHDRDALARRLEEARAHLAGLPDSAGMAEALAAAQTELTEAESARDALRAAAPDLDASRAALTRAQSVMRGAEDEANALQRDLAALDATVATLSGEGIEETLADTQLRLARAERRRDALRHEVDVLNALIEALEAAQSSARDRYFEPVLAELRPMLRLLWPGAELRFDGDSLLPVELIRDGHTEAIGTLSGGTREQISLLVRLAFARLLARQGQHAPVILDDALVFTDDERMEAMFDALHAQSGDLQILVLSCRNRALRQLGGTKLAFEDLPNPG
ncbi:AAA family ATPase [Rhodobacter sp. NTK016B]|uniref:AAA family ATPase n=1 Tax=Rhodobacter sp. NTK016B TaxID=2759676 RepID=UPI001A8D1453|nr:AAA family ATPase [Rhodobacter sp. NTK016B]MBN8290458.1 AAA family ATPase [Rhodobacter sp. NTK016B]